jgi:hypothetical protein
VGIGDPNSNTANGTGMHGVGGLQTGVGVWGNGASPPGAATATPPPGNAIGVFGAGGSGDSDGVYGVGSGHGYGGQFASGFAPMRLVPASAGTGHPTGAPHALWRLSCFAGWWRSDCCLACCRETAVALCGASDFITARAAAYLIGSPLPQ